VNVLCVVGTRPEAIKLAPVVRALRADPGACRVGICLTGQHRELLDAALRFQDLTADHDLSVMRPDQTLPDVAAAVLTGLSPLLERDRPDLVVLQGDTTSAMAAALAAFHHRVPVAHVEAGLRTGIANEPFPEEMNRRLIARLAAYHFAPTSRAREHLLAEGIPPAQVFVTGNTSIDALHWTLARVRPLPDALAPPAGGRLILVTLHRRESFGAPMEAIFGALRTIAEAAGPSVRFVCPVHPNPHVSVPMRRLLGRLPNVALAEPLDHPNIVALLEACHFVMTDSGGIQEEAPALGKPVLVLRDTTERPEGIEAGVSRLVGRSPERIVSAALELLRDEAAWARMARRVLPYGDGRAAARIAGVLLGRITETVT
jgi:UDP-N-acetylglucosamine 2-epimerase (non-hydrolysing)